MLNDKIIKGQGSSRLYLSNPCCNFKIKIPERFEN